MRGPRAALIDYGAGNLHSVHKALTVAGFEVMRATEPVQATGADALVLPGQGHFGQVMAAFRESGFEGVVRRHIEDDRPFLGICVGLQLLLPGSEEAPHVPGLGILEGWVRRFDDPEVSVPQMGWNQFQPVGDPPLLAGVPAGAFAYFANSYYVELADDSVPGAVTRHGRTSFMSVISRGRLHATQFHPEKSQRVGLKILGNFRGLVEAALPA